MKTIAKLKAKLIKADDARYKAESEWHKASAKRDKAYTALCEAELAKANIST